MKVFWLVMALLVSMASAQAPQKTVLVELFTSEGCSSCPPADALLREIDGTVESGTLVIGLSEHVTYWNQLGWADPFSQELFTARQNAYGNRFRLESVYTPQVVVNGVRQVVGNGRRAVTGAIAEVGTEAGRLQIRSATVHGKTIAIQYAVVGFAGSAEVWAVVADDKASSAVLRGENGGTRLDHVAVARDLVRLGAVRDGAMRTVSLPLPEPVRGQAAGGRHVVLFVQESGLGRVLGVDRKEL